LARRSARSASSSFSDGSWASSGTVSGTLIT
jgi:hypothetical protein